MALKRSELAKPRRVSFTTRFEELAPLPKRAKVENEFVFWMVMIRKNVEFGLLDAGIISYRQHYVNNDLVVLWRFVLNTCLRTDCRCGEMADATDLKSVFAKAKCGFESRHRHPLSFGFTRENRQTMRFGVVANRRARKRSKSQPIRQLFVNYGPIASQPAA